MVSQRSLRGGSLLAAPFWLAAILLGAFALWSALWMFGNASAPATAWLWVAIPLIGAGAASVGALGCRVRLLEDRIEDLVAWRLVATYPRSEVEAIEVRRGAWRFLVVITSTGPRPLLGLGPSQFPSTLLAESSERDQNLIATLRDAEHLQGPDTRSNRSARSLRSPGGTGPPAMGTNHGS